MNKEEFTQMLDELNRKIEYCEIIAYNTDDNILRAYYNGKLTATKEIIEMIKIANSDNL